MDAKQAYIYTIGCQMNVYDSDRIQGVLCTQGYHPALYPEIADLIIVNTCAIREKAEQKTLSALGRYTRLKKKRPRLMIGVGGCVAQQEGKKLLERIPDLDFVFGTRSINRLSDIIRRLEAGPCRIVDIEMTEQIFDPGPAPAPTPQPKATAFVTVMSGCDNFCAYCVVPYVRGRETSRSPEGILREIRGLVDAGVREVTLLGQNVNSYGKKEGLCTFAELLRRVNDIEGLERIRFTTSHPKDLSDHLMQAFVQVEKLCNHIHLPVQSGSDRVLARMNRCYTRGAYLEKIDRLRSLCPGIAISTDIIVGFPGETQADFEATLDLIQRVGCDSLFAFKYSDRPNTVATRFAEKIGEQKKKERLQCVLDLQERITIEKHRSLVGTIASILVEGKSKRQKPPGSRASGSVHQWTGRTYSNKVVNFEHHPYAISDRSLIGKMVDVSIQGAFAHSLWGTSVQDNPAPPVCKGEDHYAAQGKHRGHVVGSRFQYPDHYPQARG